VVVSTTIAMGTSTSTPATKAHHGRVSIGYVVQNTRIQGYRDTGICGCRNRI